MTILTKDLSILISKYLKNALTEGLESDDFLPNLDVSYTGAEDLFEDLINFNKNL